MSSTDGRNKINILNYSQENLHDISLERSGFQMTCDTPIIHLPAHKTIERTGSIKEEDEGPSHSGVGTSTRKPEQLSEEDLLMNIQVN
jgi:hypothetical protein